MPDVREKINGQEEGIEDFWLTQQASETYGRFAEEVIPSNSLAIEVAHALMISHLLGSILKPIILDFGCFQGSSTFRAHQILGKHFASSDLYVTGLDSISTGIEIASQRFSVFNNMNFVHVNEKDPLPQTMLNLYSVVLMFFVDQVISSNKMLKLAFSKTFNAMAKGGILIMVRLAEESFNPDLNFEFYGHNKKLKKKLLGQGEPFENELLLPKRDPVTGQVLVGSTGKILKESLVFTDHFRNTSTIFNKLSDVGFSQMGCIKISDQIKDPYLLEAYQRARFEVLNSVPQMVSSDEFKTPLHEIIWAVKC